MQESIEVIINDLRARGITYTVKPSQPAAGKPEVIEVRDVELVIEKSGRVRVRGKNLTKSLLIMKHRGIKARKIHTGEAYGFYGAKNVKYVVADIVQM